MPALAPGAVFGPLAVDPDPADLRLSPSAGPRPEAVRTIDGRCQVIELFPEAGYPEAAQEGPGANPSAHSGTRAADKGAAASSDGDARGARADRAGRTFRLARRRTAIRIQLLRLWIAGRATGQQGMATAEYAIATLGAVAFAGLLVVIMRSDEVRGFLLGIIRAALALP